MLRTRVIPVLLLRNESLVKTRRFGRFTYVGDPANTVRIFNELEVDELLFLDITATREGRKPNLAVLRDVADECFMPLGYGGGIQSLEDARQVFETGIEKVALNAAARADPSLISRIADTYGSQAVMVSIDVKASLFGRSGVFDHVRRRGTGGDPLAWAREAESRGAGEILLTSVDREGTWSGFDLELVRAVSDAVSIPVIAHGGAATTSDIGAAIRQGGASAAAVGSMVVFQKKDMGVLVNFPVVAELRESLGQQQSSAPTPLPADVLDQLTPRP